MKKCDMTMEWEGRVVEVSSIFKIAFGKNNWK